MAASASSGKYEIALGLANARQTVDLLRTQLRANMIDKDYWAARLEDLTAMLTTVADEYATSSEQRRLAALYKVSKALGSSLQLDEVLNQVLTIIGFDAGIISVLNPETKTLEIGAHYRLPEPLQSHQKQERPARR